ncbi:MAG: hypothetical protein IKE65_03750 [Clostridia bacterium]|nr:hypothetical protein [Clostridia bacterium]
MMLKKGWIILITCLLYGAVAALVAALFFQWGQIVVLVCIGLILISFLLSWWKLRCPHCKKMTVPAKSMLLGIKIGRYTCDMCGEEVRIK